MGLMQSAAPLIVVSADITSREPRSIESPAVTVSPPFHQGFRDPDRDGVYFGCGWGVLSEALTIATVNLVLNLDLPLPPSAVEILRKERAA